MLLKDKNAREIEELKKLLNKLIDLVYLQATEIDLIHFKLFMLNSQFDKALEVLELSKNIDIVLKEKLKNEVEEKIKAIKETEVELL